MGMMATAMRISSREKSLCDWIEYCFILVLQINCRAEEGGEEASFREHAGTQSILLSNSFRWNVLDKECEVSTCRAAVTKGDKLRSQLR